MPDDGSAYELVEGELRRMAPAGFQHGDVAARIGARLWQYAHDHDLGSVVAAETGFLLSRGPDTVRAPDAAFVSRHRLPPEDDHTGFLALAPDLVVEIVSPGDRAGDVAGKVSGWLAARMSCQGSCSAWLPSSPELPAGLGLGCAGCRPIAVAPA